MLKNCIICGKGQQTGKLVVRKGMAKKKGGTGKKTVRSCKRSFLPNLQKMRILIEGRPRKAYVCSRCIKKGAILKA